MNKFLVGTLAVAALVTAGSAMAADKAAKAPVKTAAVAAPVVAPVVVVTGGGYYSNITNPRWGYCPQFDYSGALFFGNVGPLCGDP